ncbi:hypothetical protein [Dyella sp. 2HG41-7]|uniref:hypothetical protein n=1 Tax=Dyella sp. 2HG41-7 TaxID=2883239 RepID=UPI001F42ECE1|nr:hypothetical protein [Dyella sp. 2HG41-7]
MIGAHGSPAKLISKDTGFPLVLSSNILAVVGKALYQAWELICAEPQKHLAPSKPGNPEEDRYTDALCEILLYWLKSQSPVDGFTADVFENVGRGENLSNYNAENINKQPDLVIRLANPPLIQARRYVGIFAETKIVSAKKQLSHYTADGMARFIRGDYAWAMQDGVMLAYQREPHRSLSTLDTKLKKEAALLTTQQQGSCLMTSGIPAQIGALSTHERQWLYTAGGKPGAVRIWHLWEFGLPSE